MKNDSSLRRTIQLAAAAQQLVCLATTGAVGAQVPVVTVAIFPDHYVLAGRYIDDLDTLEDAVAVMHPRGVGLKPAARHLSRCARPPPLSQPVLRPARQLDR